MDPNKLRLMLNNTGLQTTNNALHQVVHGLIEAVAGINTSKASPQINTIEVDTRTAAASITLKNQVKGLTLIKDKYGNAAAHNITLVGTVDGVVNPVINTNYGVFRVHPSGSAFGTW
jgi:hypothetical protein